MIERLDTSNRLVGEAIGILHTEFEREVPPDSFSSHNMDIIKTDLSTFLCMGEGREKGGDMFAISEKGELVGLSQVRYYTWEALQTQIFIASRKNPSGETLFSLQNMGKIVDSEFGNARGINYAFELTYLWIRSDFRGRRLGEALFEHSFDYIEDKCKLRSLYFIVCKSVLGGTGKGKQVFDWLVKNERKKSGVGNTQQIKFSGAPVSAKRLALLIKENPEDIKLLPQSRAMHFLAKRRGMKPIGLSRELNIVYAQVE